MNSKLIGVEDLVDELTYRVQAGSMVFLEAKKGGGKTAVLDEIINRFKGKKRVIYIDCSKVKKLNIEEIMQKRYGLMGRLLRITPSNMVLLVDNVKELSPRNIERLKFFFDNNYASTVFFTGESYARSKLPKSLKDRIGQRVVKIPRPSPDEAVEIARIRFLNRLEEQLIKKVYKSATSVGDFVEKCAKLVDYANNNNISKLKIKDVNKHG